MIKSLKFPKLQNRIQTHFGGPLAATILKTRAPKFDISAQFFFCLFLSVLAKTTLFDSLKFAKFLGTQNQDQ